MKSQLLIGTLLFVSSTALGGSVSPFTETFENGANGWLMGTFVAPTETGSGALDGSAYISTAADLNTAGMFGLTVLRGEDNFGASGDAFVGDYLAGGITTISFDIRHNAGIDLNIALRVSTSNNTPGFAVEQPVLIGSGSWVHLEYELSPTNPLWTPEGGGPGFDPIAFFENVMDSVGNIQISADRPDGLDEAFIVNFDFDNIAITPAPSASALLGLGGLVASRRRRA